MKEEKRSPLKGKPLRNPGQSLDRQISDFVDDSILQPVLAMVLLWVLTGLEWYRYIVPQPPQPALYTVMSGGLTLYVVWRVMHLVPRLKALKLGRDGERAVGQYLERLREEGCQIFHDIPGDKFNIDHVVIGPKGVYTVETKTISKPGRGEPKITFDGEIILVRGMKPDRDPITQAKAEAGWLRNFLLESSGRKVSVRPIVTFPGWYVEPLPKGVRYDVWVLETKAIPGWIEHEPETLTPEDVKLLSYHLSRYVRTAVADK
jgi:hypothetical protein